MKGAILLAIKEMKIGQQFTSSMLDAATTVEQIEYAFAVVLNKADQALVFELPRQNGSGIQWQVLHHPLPNQSDPFTAVQNALRQKTGYQTRHWSYLGSHVPTLEQPTDTGYYFYARHAHHVTDPQPTGDSPAVAKWVPLTDLRYALLDGRIVLASHALAVSLALLTLHS